jgi:hypothetical protein
MHWMDFEPRRFGWRYWHLHTNNVRLFGPIHNGRPRRWAMCR